MEEIVGALAEQQDELAGLLAGLDDDGLGPPVGVRGLVGGRRRPPPRPDERDGDRQRPRRPRRRDGPADRGRRRPPPATSTTAPRSWWPPSAARRRAPLHERWAPVVHRPPRRAAGVRARRPARPGSSASSPPARWAPPAWPRRGSTPATSPHGLGVALEPADRLWHIARLAWRTIPYAFDRAGEPRPGPVAFELTAPSGRDVVVRRAVGPHRHPRRRLRPLPGRQPPGPAGRHRPHLATAPTATSVLRLIRTWA